MQHDLGKLEAAGGIPSFPEFVDHKGLHATFGLSRAHAYILASQGAIRSVSLRKPGATRGRRLFECASVRAFLNANIDERAK